MTNTTPASICECCQAQHETKATLRVVICPEVIDPRGFYFACRDEAACHTRIEEGYEAIPMPSREEEVEGGRGWYDYDDGSYEKEYD